MIKNISLLLFLISALVLPAVTGAASHLPVRELTQTGDWEIERFNSNIEIEETGHVLVAENIEVFFDTQKHGIFREIPYQYEDSDGSIFYTEIDVISVRQDGTNVMYEESTDNGYVVLKIGDPNRTITGAHAYEITYRATGVLRSFENFDELNWNVTGFWDVPIGHAEARVTIPGDGLENFIQARCYAGEYGTDKPCDVETSSGKVVRFSLYLPLEANEGMTVAVGYAKGLVPILTADPPPSPFTTTTLVAFLATLVLALSAVGYLVWTRGRDWVMHRDSKTKKLLPLFAYEAITPEYSPPEDLHPAEIGLLQDETADTLDISAAIVYLAYLGYLKIEKKKKFKFLTFELTDYTLTKQKEPNEKLRKYEVMLLEALFEKEDTVKLNDLKDTFYKDLREIKDELYEEGVRRNFFEKNPKKVRTKYALSGAGVSFAGMMLAAFGMGSAVPLAVGMGFAVALGGLVMALLSRFMSRRSAHGRELWRQVRGYKLFIETAEKHRSRFYEEQGLFFEVLPYAIVFGLAQKLSDAFEKMGIEPVQPSWYVGPGTFNASAFASDMRSFSSSVSHTMASSPSGGPASGGGGFGGGGGFSGGGFGGGGGGSW